MNTGPRRHEKVPDGVGERDQTVALEEKHAHHVQETSQRQLAHARALYLQQSRPTLGLAAGAGRPVPPHPGARSYHGQHHQSRKRPHGHVAQQLQQFVPAQEEA